MLHRKTIEEDFLNEKFKELEITIPDCISKNDIVETFCRYTEDDLYEWLNDNFKSFFRKELNSYLSNSPQLTPDNYDIAFTDDGGKNWCQVPADIPKAHLFSIEANHEGKNIVVAGDAVLLKSDDHGKTFHRLDGEPTIAYGWLYDIGQRGDSGFVAVGSGQNIYLTDTQALSWHAGVDP